MSAKDIVKRLVEFSRNSTMEALLIETNHLLAIAEDASVSRELRPITEGIARKVLCLPTGASSGTDDVRIVSNIIRLAIDNAGEVSHQLKTHPVSC